MSEGSVLLNYTANTELIANGEGRNVLSSIEEGLQKCDEFYISVAFITAEGLLTLKPILKELEEKGVPGKILTTDYLGFNHPQVLEDLGRLTNIELKVYDTRAGQHGFHTKGYIFRSQDSYQIIIGSSNLTINALKKNREWNTRAVSHSNDSYAKEVMEEFDLYWNSEFTVPYERFLPRYKSMWTELRQANVPVAADSAVDTLQKRLEPNHMQRQFICNFNTLRSDNERRGILISATGTGKTYASAFAMRDMNPRRLLFLVHREQIAKQALTSFERVFHDSRISFGLVSGNAKKYDADFVFSTVQMMSREDILSKYNPHDFDCIIIDEVHRAGAAGYQRIIDHFKPDFLLGMTASPERTDGYDLYTLFDHNVIYEIRLQQALEEDLLCPFHYFGISDLWIDDTHIDLSRQDLSFSNISLHERVDRIIEKIRYFGHSGPRVKGLVFCADRNEAKALSDEFNRHSFRTICLTGDHAQEARERAIARLTGTGDYAGRPDEQLDYIFTVDIFNEGVDIPEINQVIMLRRTESPIIFVQQLGRGLRKSGEKEYVVILDFIGNYSTNFMIPLALSGDRSYNKDTLRRYVQSGNRIIPGASTVHFDAVAKQRIYESIDAAKFMDSKLLKEAYRDLKYKLGRIPAIQDFSDYGSVDIVNIFNKYKSYHHFLRYGVREKDYETIFTPVQEQMLQFISQKLAVGIRARDLLALELLVNGSEHILADVDESLRREYDTSLSEHGKVNLLHLLTNRFPVTTAREKFKDCIFIEPNADDYGISKSFNEALSDKAFEAQVKELIRFGLDRYNIRRDTGAEGTFILYEKYTYEQVCQLLEWPQNEVPLNIGGYKYHKETKTYPIFINYHKADDIQDTIKYEDRFESPGLIKAISKNKRTVDSEDVATALRADELGVKMYLFVRKNKDDNESKEFYYLGAIHATGHVSPVIMTGGTHAVEIEYSLDVPVRDDIYDYLING